MIRQFDSKYFLRRVRNSPRRRQHAGVACLALTLMMVGGCPPPKDDQIIDRTRPIDAPDPRSLDEIMESIHANAALLNRPLWSSAVHVTADFPDRNGKSHKYNLNGTLLYRKPRELRVDLRPSIGDQVMQIGSNADTFWIWVEPELQMMRWGKHEHAGKPCAGRMSIRPDQLAASLGLQRLTVNEPGLTGPAPQAAKDYDKLVYMREYADRRFMIEREIYVERVPPFMIRVMRFIDARGQETMRANLSDYKRVWENGPLVPHTMVFDWPQDGGRLTLEAGNLGKPTGAVNPRAFIMPDERRLPRSIQDIRQVDADCDGAPPTRSRRPEYDEPIIRDAPPDASPEGPSEEPPPAGRTPRDFRNDPNVDWSRPREPIPEGYGPPPDPRERPRPSPVPRNPNIEPYDPNRPIPRDGVAPADDGEGGAEPGEP